MTTREDEKQRDGGDWVSRQDGPEDDDLCRSTMDGAEFESGEASLIEDPWVVNHRGGRLEIWGKRENPNIVTWGFYGGILAAVSAASFVMMYSSISGPSPFVAMAVFVALIVGLAMFRLGKTSKMVSRLLCEIDVKHQVISWPTTAKGTLVAVAFDDVESVTYELIDFPVKDSRAGTHIGAAAVMILDHQGRQIPIIEASTSKGEAHQIARVVAKALEQSVDYVGTGVRDRP